MFYCRFLRLLSRYARTLLRGSAASCGAVPSNDVVANACEREKQFLRRVVWPPSVSLWRLFYVFHVAGAGRQVRPSCSAVLLADAVWCFSLFFKTLGVQELDHLCCAAWEATMETQWILLRYGSAEAGPEELLQLNVAAG